MANDFSGDSNCKALWRFESGALTTDDIGSNTLTNYASRVSADTDSGDFKEGSASACFVSSTSPRLYVDDADLDAAFPLKSSASSADFSICLWFKLADISANYTLVAKNVYSGSNDDSLFVYTRDYDTYYGIRVLKGYNSGNSTETWEAVTSLDLQSGRWYHLGLTWDDSNKQFSIVVWDDTAQAKYTDSDTQSYSIALTSAPFNLGARADSSDTPYNELNGWLDEVVAFSDILTASEIDEIRQGTYGVSGTEHELQGAIASVSGLSGNVAVIRGLFGSAEATTSLTTILNRFTPIAGVVGVRARPAASLQRSRTIARTRADWPRETLLNGTTSNASKLGTILTGGWFWMRRAGCAVVYRGPTLTDVDFDDIVSAVNSDTQEVLLPGGLQHEPNGQYCYLVRRYNGCGDLERTTLAAIRIRIGPEGGLAEPMPNGVYGLSAQTVAGDKVRLTWFYCPLDQPTPPAVFRVYGDGDTGQLDLQSELETIPYEGRRFYSHLSGSLPQGHHAFAVLAESNQGIQSLSLSRVHVPVRTSSPTSMTILSTEVTAL